jgi:hypothetical protein
VPTLAAGGAAAAAAQAAEAAAAAPQRKHRDSRKAEAAGPDPDTETDSDDDLRPYDLSEGEDEGDLGFTASFFDRETRLGCPAKLRSSARLEFLRTLGVFRQTGRFWGFRQMGVARMLLFDRQSR